MLATCSSKARSTRGLGSSSFMFTHCSFACQAVMLRMCARTLWARIRLIEGAFVVLVNHNHHSLDVTLLGTQEHWRTVSKTTAKIRVDRQIPQNSTVFFPMLSSLMYDHVQDPLILARNPPLLLPPQ